MFWLASVISLVLMRSSLVWSCSITFNISVNDLILMQVSHSLKNLPRITDHNLLIKRPILCKKVCYWSTYKKTWQEKRDQRVVQHPSVVQVLQTFLPQYPACVTSGFQCALKRQATKRRQRVAKPREEWDETQTTHYPISPLPPPPIIGKVCTAVQWPISLEFNLVSMRWS